MVYIYERVTLTTKSIAEIGEEKYLDQGNY